MMLRITAVLLLALLVRSTVGVANNTNVEDTVVNSGLPCCSVLAML